MPMVARKVALKDTSLKAMRPASAGTRYTVWDQLLDNFAVRVTDKGKRSFYAVKRRKDATVPTWVLLGAYPAMSLGQARDAARGAIAVLEAGEDPKTHAKEQRRAQSEAEAKAKANTLRSVAEKYLDNRERSQKPLRANTRRAYDGYLKKLYPLFGNDGDQPVAEITRKQVVAALDRVREESGIATTIGAKSLLTVILDFALGRDLIDANPAAGIKAELIVGPSGDGRDRRLSDAELAAVWRGLDGVGQPFSSLYKILLLTGLRLNEVAGARWSELRDGVLTIPAERSKNGESMAVPLSPLSVEIFEAMPRFTTGDYVFTTTAGRRPVSAFSHAKARLDAALSAPGAQVADFVVHDFRRTFRSGLSALGISREIAEACLNHKKPGIVDVYDKHDYLDEKRDALRRWEARLLAIVAPEPEPQPAGDNVVPMRARA